MIDGYDILALLSGIACAAVGGELFVRGAIGASLWLRIPTATIGSTIAAFATSSPEGSVALSSSLAGRPSIALGDALGSNVVNIALVLGIALLGAPLAVNKSRLKRELRLALSAPLLTGFLLFDGELSRFDGAVLASIFILWLTATVRQAREDRKTADPAEPQVGWTVVKSGPGGLVLLILAGRLIIEGATGISQDLGVPPFLMGATVVSLGTSVPELATVIVSKFRGHEAIGLGTILGSNIFNNLFIVSIAALITPISVPLAQVMLAIAFGVASILVILPTRNGLITRAQGGLLVSLYVAYVAVSWTTLAGGSSHAPQAPP